MNILVYHNPRVDGCVYYRQVLPIGEVGMDFNVDVTFTNNTKDIPDEELEKFDIIQCHKGYIPLQLDRYKDLGIATVVDFDDYWDIPRSHGLYGEYHYEYAGETGNKKMVKVDGKPVPKKQSTPDFFREVLRNFDYVTTTTDLLAEYISKYNKNVEVFPNAINPTYPMWERRATFYPRIRFGWIGGSQHYIDIKMLEGTPRKLANSDARGKYDMNLFGYMPGTVYDNFAEIFTDKGRYMDSFRWYPPRPVLQEEGKPSYAQYYNDIDVALIPLADTKFNASKSELKLIEAGFFHKPSIVSNLMPYTNIIADGNCLKVNNSNGWFKKMRQIVNNPSLIRELGENLYESVKDRYDIRSWTPKRHEFYKKLL